MLPRQFIHMQQERNCWKRSFLFGQSWSYKERMTWGTLISLGVSWLMLAPPGSLQQTTIYWNCSAWKQNSPHHWKFSKAHTGSRFTLGFQNSVYIWYNRSMQAISGSHTKSWKWKCSQHWTRRTATQEIYKRLNLGGGQSYDRSSEETAVVAVATNNRAWSAVLSMNWQRPCVCCIHIHLIICNMQIVHTDKRIITAD
jgi:hypothetical protein